jgi:hypothetical protein
MLHFIPIVSILLDLTTLIVPGEEPRSSRYYAAIGGNS